MPATVLGRILDVLPIAPKRKFGVYWVGRGKGDNMALTKEDLLAIGELMDAKLKPMDLRLGGIDHRLDGIDVRLDGIDARLDRMQEDIDQIKEDAAITRTATNSLIEWAESVSVITQVKFPVKKAGNAP